MTVSNPSPSATFTSDAQGLGVLSGPVSFLNHINSFQISFDTTVQLNSYNVGFVGTLDGNESMTLTAGAQSSVESFPFATGLRTFANMITVAAGQVITVVNSGNDSIEAIQWNQITVTEVTATTPEPVSLVALLGVGALGFASRKKK